MLVPRPLCQYGRIVLSLAREAPPPIIAARNADVACQIQRDPESAEDGVDCALAHGVRDLFSFVCLERSLHSVRLYLC